MNFDSDLNNKYSPFIEFYGGVDEVGRGPLAGPVVAACVLVENLNIEFLKKLSDLGVSDSKKISAKKRSMILKELDIVDLKKSKQYKVGIDKTEVYFSIEEVSVKKIDEINILNASLLAMKKSYQNARSGKNDLGLLLIDGNKEPSSLPKELFTETVIKGDLKSLIIGLASIIAKEYRDQYMIRLGEKYPGFGLEKHAGYPTKLHREAIKNFGPTKHHRKTFRGVKEYLGMMK